MEDILAILFIFGGGTLVALGFSPIGRAVADAIRHRTRSGVTEDVNAELRDIRAEVSHGLDEIQRQIGELAERVDFAERLLAKNRDAQRIGPGQ